MKAFGIVTDKRSRTSLRLPESVLEKIASSMRENSYNSKQRSKWICEALGKLVTIEDYCELIAEEFMDKGGNEVISMTLDQKTLSTLSIIENNYLEKFNFNIIDKSVILRTAIVQRLIRERGGIIS